MFLRYIELGECENLNIRSIAGLQLVGAKSGSVEYENM